MKKSLIIFFLILFCLFECSCEKIGKKMITDVLFKNIITSAVNDKLKIMFDLLYFVEENNYIKFCKLFEPSIDTVYKKKCFKKLIQLFGGFSKQDLKDLSFKSNLKDKIGDITLLKKDKILFKVNIKKINK